MSQENDRQPEWPAMPAVGSSLDSATRALTRYDESVKRTILTLDYVDNGP